MNSTFFSVIIPTFNRSHILRKTINSVLNQTFENFEVIIVDDGSTDNTKDVIKVITESDSRVKYIYQKNSERAIARNNGVLKAKGEFYIFLDSDDFFEPTHLFDLNEFIHNSAKKEALFFTNAKVLQNNVLKNLPIFQSSTFEIDFFLKNSIIPARVCLHNSILNKFQFDPDTIVVEDTVLWTEITSCYPIIFVDIDSVVYYLHDDNSVNIQKNNAYKKRLHGLRKLFNEKKVGSLIPKKTKREQIDNCYFGIAKHHFHNNRKNKYVLWLLISLLKYPRIRTKEKLYLIINLNNKKLFIND
jgi:glycosyltransferase involved in cell wall biosynthesis